MGYIGTGVAVCFDNKLGKLKLQTYQRISPVKKRGKPADNVQNRKIRCGGRENFLSFVENAGQKRGRNLFRNSFIPDDKNSCNQVLAWR